MFFKLLLLFVIVPLVELALLFILADATHWWVSMLLILITALIGTWLAQQQGLRTMSQIRGELGQGQMPTTSLMDAAMIFVAGAFLLTPGVLTDLFGISLLLPPCRKFYRAKLAARFKSRFEMHTGDGSPDGARSKIIDSYVVDSDDKNDDENKS